MGIVPPVLADSSLIEQSILLLDQLFNTTPHFWRKNVLETLINDKSKVKEILREQSDCLNDASNQFFLRTFKNEFSKSVDPSKCSMHFSLPYKSR